MSCSAAFSLITPELAEFGFGLTSLLEAWVKDFL
jgi:hypothetical protein